MTAAPTQHRAPPGFYFIYLYGCEDGSEIKIGHTRRHPARRREHENRQGHHQPMRTLAVVLGQLSDERTLKQYFGRHTSRPRSDEWFDAHHPPLRDYLRFLRAQPYVARDDHDLERVVPVSPGDWLPRDTHTRQIRGQESLFASGGPWADLDVDDAEGDYYTNEDVIAAIRYTMGGIDTDPCSCREANEVVKATRYYGLRENGLLVDWPGRVWLSPPFGAWDEWVPKALRELDAGHTTDLGVIVTASSSTNVGFHPLVARADALCVPRGRLAAWGPKATAAHDGNYIYYVGPSVHRFCEAFARIGTPYLSSRV
jgi:hypothetical protein